MSGGSFNYAYTSINDFADQLELILSRQGQPDSYGDAYSTYAPEVQVEFRRILAGARRFAFEMREVEWHVSGDTGDESFLSRIKEGPQ